MHLSILVCIQYIATIIFSQSLETIVTKKMKTVFFFKSLSLYQANIAFTDIKKKRTFEGKTLAFYAPEKCLAVCYKRLEFIHTK